MLKLYTPNKMPNFCFSRKLTCSSSSSISHDCSASSSSNYMAKLTGRILSSKNPREALTYFDSVKDQINIMKNRRAHSAIVHVLIRGKMYVEARCLLKCLIQDLLKTCTPRRVSAIVYRDLNRIAGDRYSRNVFGNLIIALSELGLVDEAVWVYREIGDLPSIQACNALLNGLVKLDRVGCVWEMYEEMVTRGLGPSVHTYGTLMVACRSDIVRCRKLFDEMVHKGIKPTIVIFTTLIRSLCNGSKMSEADNLFRTMKESGVVPNLYTYNTLIDGHCKMDSLTCALGLFKEILGQNLEPNVVTFGILVDGFCKNGKMDAAMALFPRMVKTGVPANVFVYNSLIDGLCKDGNISEALAFYVDKGKYNILPDVLTYSILAKSLSEVGRVKEAVDIMSKMKYGGILPNSVTYNSQIDSHCKRGDMDKALQLCSQMVEEGIRPNALTFSPLIHRYCREGNMEAARRIYLEMITKRIAPDVVTYTSLMNGYFMNQDTDAALGIYKEMQEAGISPNAFTICCLIDGLCKDGRVNDAFRRFLKFTSSAPLEGIQSQFDVNKFPINHVVYTALIQGLCKEGKIFKASKFFSDMRVHGLRADQLTYRIIISGHARARHIHNLLMLQADMFKLGFLPDKVVYPFLCKAYQIFGDAKSALMCLEDQPS